MTLRQTLSKLSDAIDRRKKRRIDSNDVLEGDEAEIEENSEESGDEDSFETTSASKRGRGRTRGVSLEKSLGVRVRETIGAYPGGRVWRSVFHCCHPIDEDWNVGRGLIPISLTSGLMFLQK
ncbi:hypothetical protein CJ030_MR0G007911 [Morella rubra]|uniref:Uncharacterized protein n=1 Tax=Morella rubra TaxID=262757 RepID=A0A6A1UIZ3_9ROSI|nr:hypothetical protein CJ030_MR0G007911 [Morella rubra]